MAIDSDKKELAEIAALLKKARMRAERLPCMCEEFATCGKHRIVDDITAAEDNIRAVLAAM